MLLERIKYDDPNKVALRDEVQSISYADLPVEIDKRVESLSNVSCLAIVLDNSVEWVLWDLAALKAKIPCVPIPPFFTQEQVSHSLNSAGVSHIISSKGLRDVGQNLAGEIPANTAKVTFTSGTTGRAKGVCLSEEALENVASSVVKLLGDKFTGTHFCVLPLSVLLENIAGVYAGLLAGCTIELTNLQSFGSNYEKLHEYLVGVMSVILVPEILRILMTQVMAKGGLSSLKFIAVGGSKIDPALVKQARAMGLPVYEGYGLSECASVVSLNTPENDKIGTVGKVLPHLKVRISDGEIQIKNTGFLGYVGQDAPSLFNTGDLGSLDNDGFLSITGRKKNVLITSYGRNISPEWVEALLLLRQDIAQVVVYGDAQPHLSALIVPSSQDADIQNVIDGVNSDLPDYAQIKDFKIVAPFTLGAGTLTGTGRARREHILNQYI